jgi:hypothetical protein
MKLDEKAIDKMIAEVLSEVAMPSITDVTLSPQEKSTKKKPAYIWSSTDEWPKVTKRTGKTNVGAADYKIKLQALFDALSIKNGASILKLSKMPAGAFLQTLAKNGLAKNPPNKIDERDLQLSFTDGGKLPAGGVNYFVNLVRMEYLSYLAINDDSVFEYIKNIYKIDPEKHLGILRQGYRANTGKVGKFLDDELTKRLDRSQVVQQPTDNQATVTEPSFSTQRAERAAPSLSEFEIFNNFRGADLSSTIKRLTDFSLAVLGPNKVNENEEGNQLGPVDKAKELLTNVLVMDYLITFSKEIDHGAGAYFFEAFLAFLSGGQAGGKAKGAAGGMGESDFIKGDGSKGSAKYLQTGSNIDQAAKSFFKNDPVEYVVAHKVDSSGAKTSDPDKLYALNIHTFTVEKITEPDEKGIVTFDVGGTEQKVLQTGKLVLKPLVTDTTKVGTLYLAKLDSEDIKPYRQSITDYANTLDDISKQAFVQFETLSKQLNIAKEKSKIYATGGRKDDGAAAITAMGAAKTGQDSLINIFENPTPEQTNESKLTSLDQLIAETLRDIKKSIK